MSSYRTFATCLAISILFMTAFAAHNAIAVELFTAGDRQATYFDGSDWHTLYEEMGVYEVNRFNAVWTFSETDLLAVGPEGVLAHYDGSGWSDCDIEVEEDLNDIWAASGSDIFVVGDTGMILYSNGMIWRELQSGTTADLNAVWGVSENSVYAAGDNILLYYDGKKWSVVETGYPYDYKTIWASSDTDIFVGPYYEFGSPDAYILHYDGASWSLVPTPNTAVDIWGVSSSDVFVSCYSWYVLHYDGDIWSEMIAGYDFLHGLSGTSATDVYVTADHGRVYHYNGVGWSLSLEIDTDADFYGVHALSEDFVAAVGRYGHALAYTFDGVEWTSILSFVPSFNGIWGFAADDVYLAGTGLDSDNAYLYHWNGAELTQARCFVSVDKINGIWGTSSNDHYVLPYSQIYRYDGAVWTPVLNAGLRLNDIHGNGSDNVYAVGDQGIVYHYDGIEWSQIRHVPPTGLNQNLHSVWVAPNGEVFAGGIVQYDDGDFWNDWYSVIVHYDGFEWNESYPLGQQNYSPNLWTIWGSAPNNVYTGGHDYLGHTFPNMIHFDGSDWNDTSCPIEPYDLWGTGSDDVYVCSLSNSSIFHYDGIDWNEISVPTSKNITALHGWVNTISAGETPSSAPTLTQNYPNPFNPATTIRFNLPRATHVDLRIYDVSGRYVITLLDKVVDPGTSEIHWNGKDDRVKTLASGVYFYRLVAGDFKETKKMVLLR